MKSKPSSPRRFVSSAVVALTLAAGCTSGGESDLDNSAEPTAAAEDDRGCDVEYPDWQTSPYVLPFHAGEEYEMGLGNCSSSFHAAGQPDEFAYDFDLPIGADVIAARAGTVDHLDESHADFGGGIGNILLISHGDGTVGAYLHFTTNGIDVEVGDQVEQGQLLGTSGASGLAGYPHLHFIVVEEPSNFPWTGVPVTFSNMAPNPRGPAQGEVVRALDN